MERATGFDWAVSGIGKGYIWGLLVIPFLFLGGLAGWLAGGAGAEPTKWLHASWLDEQDLLEDGIGGTGVPGALG